MKVKDLRILLADTTLQDDLEVVLIGPTGICSSLRPAQLKMLLKDYKGKYRLGYHAQDGWCLPQGYKREMALVAETY